MNWQTVISNSWVQGVGGSLIASILWVLGKRVFGRRKDVQSRGVTVQQHASPVMTQNVHVHPAPSAPAAPTTILELKTRSEFEKVQELWKRILTLKNAFWNLPKAGGFDGPRPGSRESAEFLRSYGEAAKFLDEETLCIPESIADEAAGLLKVAFEEAV